MKGVSPLVSSVLLIVLVVSLTSLITTWLTTLVITTQDTVSETSGESIQCSNADITIDEVFVLASGGRARAIVRNSGLIDNLSVSTAQIINSDGSNYAASNLPILNLNKGDIITLDFLNDDISCSSFSQIFVSTNCAGVSESFTGTPRCS